MIRIIAKTIENKYKLIIADKSAIVQIMINKLVIFTDKKEVTTAINQTNVIGISSIFLNPNSESL